MAADNLKNRGIFIGDSPPTALSGTITAEHHVQMKVHVDYTGHVGTQGK